jgi:hypothetical protein
MTSYQRQKEKIKQLENQVEQLNQELVAVVKFPNSQEANQVKLKIKMIYGIDQFIWTGSGEPPTMQGIYNMITK